jgi:hypothetical protein
MQNFLIKGMVIITVLFIKPFLSLSQTAENTPSLSHFNGAISVTNNGISFIPTFTLGKPAAIFDLSMGKRLSFDPQFRFALEGKPWSFLFWWRYKLITGGKFRLNIGAHPALSFKTLTITNNGVPQEITKATRYVATEIVPNYLVAKDITIGAYYLYSHGIEKDAVGNTNFLTLNASFSHISIPWNFFLRLNPQIYYLRMDKNDGFYYTASLTLAKKDCPISISGMFNKIIKTNITASKDFVWNVSLIYSFNNNYVKK